MPLTELQGPNKPNQEMQREPKHLEKVQNGRQSSTIHHLIREYSITAVVGFKIRFSGGWKKTRVFENKSRFFFVSVISKETLVILPSRERQDAAERLH